MSGLSRTALTALLVIVASTASALAQTHMEHAPPSPAETDMLDMALAVEPNSRLSCQIVCKPELDGITLTIAPE